MLPVLILRPMESTTVFKPYNNQVVRAGFTLIELLVATTLLVLLSTVVIASFRQANITARDSKRKADLQQVRGLVETYRLENGAYPGDLAQIYTSQSGFFLTELGLTGSTDYVDPVNDAEHYYRYIRQDAPGCAYELGALMESTSNAQSCGACGSAPAGTYYCVTN